MSEVKRYWIHWNDQRYVADENGDLVSASDFDAESLRADTAVAEVVALREELAKSKALSVTNILMDVVPGYDGMGEEVFAKSVAEVCEKLGEFAMQVEDLDSTTSRLHDVAILCATVEQRLTAAEQLNAELVELLRELDDNWNTGHVTTSPVVVMDWDDEGEQVQSLYASQPAPVAVVLPERLTSAELEELEVIEALLHGQGLSNLAGTMAAARQFIDEIACLDKVKELNQSPVKGCQCGACPGGCVASARLGN